MRSSNWLSEEQLRTQLRALLHDVTAHIAEQGRSSALHDAAAYGRAQITAWMSAGRRLEEEGPRVTPALLVLLMNEEIDSLGVADDLGIQVLLCASELLCIDSALASVRAATHKATTNMKGVGEPWGNAREQTD